MFPVRKAARPQVAYLTKSKLSFDFFFFWLGVLGLPPLTHNLNGRAPLYSKRSGSHVAPSDGAVSPFVLPRMHIRMRWAAMIVIEFADLI